MSKRRWWIEAWWENLWRSKIQISIKVSNKMQIFIKCTDCLSGGTIGCSLMRAFQIGVCRLCRCSNKKVIPKNVNFSPFFYLVNFEPNLCQNSLQLKKMVKSKKYSVCTLVFSCYLIFSISSHFHPFLALELM